MDSSDMIRDNHFKMKRGRFRLNIRKIFNPTRKVKNWTRSPKADVKAPVLEMFKAKLGRALISLV